MKLYTARLPVWFVTVCLCTAQALSSDLSAEARSAKVEARSAKAEQAPPQLSRQQRETLLALVTAVDGLPTDLSAVAPSAKAEARSAKVDDAEWQTHLMRASDGSHYVAFTIAPGASRPLPSGPALLYVRLATSNPLAAQKIAERSVIREWLAGSRIDPRLLPRRAIAIGDMPAFGAGGIAVRGSTPTTGSNDLKLMAMERERAKKEQEERDRQRRAELEGKAPVARDVYPFEDFDLASQSVRDDGTRIVARAFTAGPGEYDLFVAWADPSNPKPLSTVRVMRQSLHLPPAASTGLTTGSIILADKVSVRAAPYPPTEQAAHPYSIGLLEIAPARDAIYTRDDALAVAFQIINAQPSETGMPDVVVGFRVVRVAGDRETPIASLNPQSYNNTTLPPEFDLRRGHPIFAAVSAPLATLRRGDYRLKIAINDRVGGTGTTADADFRIVGTPTSLLAEAPPLGRPFSRDRALEPAAVASLVQALTPASPSPQLLRALETARAGRLIDLLVEEPVPAAEAGIRTVLTGLALLSVGDQSAAVQFQRALQQNAPAAAVQYLIGAARALQSRDADAIAAWQAALTTGQAPAMTRHLLVEAYLRRGEAPRAAGVIAEAGPMLSSPDWTRLTAATHIATGNTAAAIALLDTHLAAHSGDADARWLLLHALYADAVKGANRDRFAGEARRYLDGKGTHAELVTEWLKMTNDK
jgi:hypothetical protein